MLLAIFSIICLLLTDVPLFSQDDGDILSAAGNHAENSIVTLETRERSMERESTVSAKEPMEWILSAGYFRAKMKAMGEKDDRPPAIGECFNLVRYQLQTEPREWIVCFDYAGTKGLAKFEIASDGACFIEYLLLISTRDH